MNSEDIGFLIGAVMVVLLATAIILGLPFAQIWAVNTLFQTNIEYNLFTWLAVLVLNSTLKLATYKYEKK